MRPLFALLVTLLMTAGAAADEQTRMSPEAQRHLDTGLAHFAAQEYNEAIAEFRAGYALEPHPVFLYTMAQAERMSGDCPTAITLYRRFLAADPPEQQAKAARHNLARCEEALGAGAAVVEPAPEPEPLPPEPEPPPPEPEPVVVQPVRESAPVTWYRDPITLALLGGGVACLGLGLGFTVASLSNESSAEHAATYGESNDLLDRAETQRTIGFVSFAAGTVLVGTAVVRELLGAPRRRDEPAVTGWVSPSGAGLAVGGAF
jgi:tetratricopeptide (TPR) repeat protein